MNTLTKNRIIEKGDEYLLDGKWQPIPAKLHGMQVMFTGLTQVRRPTEEPTVPHTAKVISRNEEPISPHSEKPETGAGASREASVSAIVTAKAESENAPVPTHSGTGVTLPTVVSRKAHRVPMAEMSAEDAIKLADTLATVFHPYTKGKARLDAHIPYPAGSIRNQVRWIGRNGTFNATGLNLHAISDGRIRIVPHGKRGEAKNALIEFPVEVIPQIIEWLKEHQP